MSKICQSNRLNTVELTNIYTHTHTYILFSTRRWVSSFSEDLLRRTLWESVNIETLNIVG